MKRHFFMFFDRKWLIIFLICSLFCMFLKTDVYAEEDESSYVSRTVGYTAKSDEKNLELEFYYDDRMMLEDANVLSGDLAKVSIGLACAAYQTGDAEKCFSDMGYELLGGSSYNYDRDTTYDDNDFVGYTIGYKVIEGYNVYIVAVRGTPKSEEWISDFHLGDGEYHYGFYNAANEILDTLSQYVTGTNNIFLCTGHSRGAAVANIVAGEITTRIKWASPDHVFGYNFACPAVKLYADTSLTNIRNYLAPGDVIPELPLKDWGYNRYGETTILSTESEVYRNFLSRFRAEYNLDFAGAASTYEFVAAIKTIAATKEDFNTLEHQMLFDVVGYLLGGMQGDTLDAIEDKYGGIGMAFVTSGALRRLLKNASSYSIQYAADSETERNEEFYSEINLALNATARYTQEEFDDWIKYNSDLLDRIKTQIGVTIETREDLEDAGSMLKDQMDVITYVSSNLVTLSNLYVTTGGSFSSLVNSVWHSHQQGTYALWINSMYYGYKGWYNNDSLKEVSIPDSIHSIGTSCFENCTSLETVSISGPSKIWLIGNKAFCRDTNLTEMTELTGNLQYIGVRAFFNCSNLASAFTIPDTIKTIGREAFSGCVSIPKITIPVDYQYKAFYENDAASPYLAVFYGCTGVKEIHYTKGTTGIMPDHNDAYSQSGDVSREIFTLESCVRGSLEKVEFDEGVIKIGASAYYNYEGYSTSPKGSEKLREVILPESLEVIGPSAFNSCTALEEITLPQNLRIIGASCFNGCSAIQKTWSEFGMPASLTAFPDYAFSDCTGLTGELVIPDTVTQMSKAAFKNCSGITKITVPVDYQYKAFYKDGTAYPSLAVFYGCTGVKEIHYTKGTTGIMPDHNDAYNQSGDVSREIFTLESCVRGSLEKVEFDEGVIKIGASAYYNYEGYSTSPKGSEKLREVILPESLEVIGPSAFNSCTALEEITLPQNLGSIGAYCFYGCSAIRKTWTEFGMPASLTAFPDYVFSDCTGLTGELVIPDNVTQMSKAAFKNCSGITKITVPVDYKYSAFYTDGSANRTLAVFAGCTGVKEIHYTKGTTGIMLSHTDAYSQSGNVSRDIFTLECCVCSSLEVAVFDDGITKIGLGAFYNSNNPCRNLKVVVLPESIDGIASNAFSGCSSATIYSFKDSYAESYADTNSIPFIPLCYPLFEEVPEEIEKGALVQLGVKVYVSWDNATEEAEWSISGNENDETAITEDGLLTVARKETAEAITVTASYGEYSNSATIRIIPKQGIIDVESIVIDPAEAEMRTSKTILEKPYTITEASTLQLTALIEPEDATNQDVTWISSNPEVAEVDENGLVTALTYGEAVITATTEDGSLTANCRIQTRYNDVAEPGYWFDPVYWAADYNITKGYANIYFGPEENCTREQMITFLYRTAGSPAVSGSVSFSDVKKGSYYYNAVLWAYENGITKGYSSGPYKGKFGVGLNVTREDTVTFIYRMAGKPMYSTTKSFKDVAKGKYYYDPVRWAAQNGITKGYSDGTFGVGKDVLRKDIVTFLYRYDNMRD